ncbi:MAG: penicillin-insensitive murein endopeptidase [Polyangiaceae bacterium]|nr:penicillin-insensitive murein endopeptidase [Polyangiaceae bacterium]MCW5791342.1 penicillin-insensitive murein endopeptidase [Polyangiaceae bacterium]
MGRPIHRSLANERAASARAAQRGVAVRWALLGALAASLGCSGAPSPTVQASPQAAPGAAQSAPGVPWMAPSAQVPPPRPDEAKLVSEGPGSDEHADHDDDVPDEEPTLGEPTAALDSLTDAELLRRFDEEPDELGGISIGTPNAGRLLTAQRMPTGEHWRLVDPAHAYGTRETVAFLTRAILRVQEEHPGGHPLYIGHISAKAGGPLSPHKSHQAGRDVDISYYYREEASARWYKRATADNLDLPRTWAFVRALIAETDIDLILIDAGLQRVLRSYAEELGEDPAWLEDVFKGGKGRRPLILHAPGHATHIHIRFFNPVAQEAGRRLYPALVQRGVVAPPAQFVSYRAKKGDTLAVLAKRFDTTVQAIMRANGLRSTLIRAKVTYRIPKQVGVKMAPPSRIPPRRVPPPRVAVKSPSN